MMQKHNEHVKDFARHHERNGTREKFSSRQGHVIHRIGDIPRDAILDLVKGRESEGREAVTLSSAEAEQINGALDSEGKEHPELKKLLSGHEEEEHW